MSDKVKIYLRDQVVRVNVKGAQGSQGIQGTQGIQGVQGIQGIQGEAGPAGLLSSAEDVAIAMSANAFSGSGGRAIAVVDSPGGYITMASMWTYFKSLIDAGMTWAGAQVFSSTTRPTSSGTGLPAATSLITRADAINLIARDNITHVINYAMGAAVTASGGSSTASRGYWQLFTGATASSLSQILFDLANITGSLDFGRRIILRTRIGSSALRAGLQLYFQIGRAVVTSTAAQLTNKGFGIGISGSTVTPFVHNGSSLTTTLATGSTFSFVTYPGIMLDFRPGVSLDIYGISTSSSTPVLLCTITSGLPTGLATGTNAQLEWLKYDTGAGGANDWTYLGHSSITID